jgi:hypothetical protein
MGRSTRNLAAVGLLALLTGPALAQNAADATQVNRVVAGLNVGATARVPVAGTAAVAGPLVGPYGGFNSIQPGVPAGTTPTAATTTSGETATGRSQCARFFTGLGTAVSLGPGVARVGTGLPGGTFGSAPVFVTSSVAAPGVSTLARSPSGFLQSNAGIATLGAGVVSNGVGVSNVAVFGLTAAGPGRGSYGSPHAATYGGRHR